MVLPRDESWRSTRIRVGDLDLHVVAAGPEDGAPVVLLHGFPEFWFGWRSQIPALAAAGYRVLAPDQRGYNLSAAPRRVSDYGLDRLVDDVLALLDARGIERARLVGHDWGGAVAWWSAVRAPDRLEQVAILNCPHPVIMRQSLLRSRTQRRRSRYMAFFQLPWLPEAALRREGFAKLERALTRTALPGTFSPADLETYRRAWSQPHRLRGALHWYRAALRRPPRSVASPRVRVPLLMLWGERDRFLGRELVEPSLALCDDGRLELLPEATHWLQHEMPEVINAALLHFFAGAPQPLSAGRSRSR